MDIARRQLLKLGVAATTFGIPGFASAGKLIQAIGTAQPAISVWDVGVCRELSGAKFAPRRSEHGMDGTIVGSVLGRSDYPSPMAVQFRMRIVAVGACAQRVVAGFESTAAASNLSFTNLANDSCQPVGDLTVFIGDTASLAQESDLAVREEWSLGIVLDAESAGALEAYRPDLAQFGQLFYAAGCNREATVSVASDMLDMLITVVMRDGMVGTDSCDIRRVLTLTGEARFNSLRGTGVANIRQAIDAAASEAKIDSATKGVLAVVAGPNDLTIDDFIYLNERIAPEDDSVAEVLVTMKTLQGTPDDAYAVAIWTIRNEGRPLLGGAQCDPVQPAV